MTLRELKERLSTLSEYQLNQQAIVFNKDEEVAIEIDEMNISEEDMYWEHHGDLAGNLEQLKEELGDEFDDLKEDYIIVPAGTVTFQSI